MGVVSRGWSMEPCGWADDIMAIRDDAGMVVGYGNVEQAVELIAIQRRGDAVIFGLLGKALDDLIETVVQTAVPGGAFLACPTCGLRRAGFVGGECPYCNPPIKKKERE